MTTPRDDIAGLSERLRRLARITRRAIETSKMVSPWSADSETLGEAATQLDSLLKGREALQARVKELEDHNRRLGQGSAERYWEGRYRDEAAACARAEQERDEAIKLIRPLTILAEDTARISSKHGSEFAPEMSSLAARARSFVRRLACPEKEKKE